MLLTLWVFHRETKPYPPQKTLTQRDSQTPCWRLIRPLPPTEQTAADPATQQVTDCHHDFIELGFDLAKWDPNRPSSGILEKISTFYRFICGYGGHLWPATNPTPELHLPPPLPLNQRWPSCLKQRATASAVFERKSVKPPSKVFLFYSQKIHLVQNLQAEGLHDSSCFPYFPVFKPSFVGGMGLFLKNPLFDGWARKARTCGAWVRSPQNQQAVQFLLGLVV